MSDSPTHKEFCDLELKVARVEEAVKDFTLFKVLVGTALASALAALIIVATGGK